LQLQLKIGILIDIIILSPELLAPGGHQHLRIEFECLPIIVGTQVTLVWHRRL
jgi:hypothetical protein